MDTEKFETVKDPFCSLVGLVQRLSKMLVGCIEETESPKVCYHECLKVCGGDCEVACLGAVEVALGVAVAKDVIRSATTTTCPLDNIINVVIDMVVLQFKELLRGIEKMECPKRAVAARVLTIAALTLHKVFKKVSERYAQDILMLIAPALAAARRCGEQVDIEMIKPFIGEEVAERITAALRGRQHMNDVSIEFEPVVQ